MDPSADTPDLEELHAFLAVVELQGFTAAAQRLGVPKSTVSRRVTRVEEKLGVRLLQRSTRRLHLTDAGSAYYESVARALGNLEEAARLAQEQQDVPRGHLRITAPSDLGISVLGELILAFAEAHPAVTVEVDLSARKVDLIAEGYDLAFRAASQLEDSSLIARRVGAAGVRLYAPRGYEELRPLPVRVADLAEHPCVVFRGSRGRARWRLQGAEGEEEVEVAGQLSANDFHFVRSLLLRGALAVAPLPSLLAGADVESGALVPVLPDRELLAAHLYVVYPSAELLPAKVRVFRDYAIEWLSRRLPP